MAGNIAAVHQLHALTTRYQFRRCVPGNRAQLDAKAKVLCYDWSSATPDDACTATAAACALAQKSTSFPMGLL